MVIVTRTFQGSLSKLSILRGALCAGLYDAKCHFNRICSSQLAKLSTVNWNRHKRRAHAHARNQPTDFRHYCWQITWMIRIVFTLMVVFVICLAWTKHSMTSCGLNASLPLPNAGKAMVDAFRWAAISRHFLIRLCNFYGTQLTIIMTRNNLVWLMKKD